MPQIQALHGSILNGQNRYAAKVLPLLLLNERAIDIVHEEDLTLTHVFEDSYRIKMLNSSPQTRLGSPLPIALMGRMDHRHWYYDDELFAKYIHTIASFQLPTVCLFESPFGH